MAKSASNKPKRDVSAIMRKVRSTNTSPEVALRNALESAGFQPNDEGKNDLPGKPDIVLPEERLAVFVDGDFWHGGQWRKRKFASLEDQFKEAPSGDYWIKKIRRNVNRDFSNTNILLEQGWKVIRFWESQIRKDLDACVKSVVLASKERVKRDVCSIVPQRAFAEFTSGKTLHRTGLESKGWTILSADQKGAVPLVTLAIAYFSRIDISSVDSIEKASKGFVAFVSEISSMKRRKPPLLLLEIPATLLTLRKKESLSLALLKLNGLGYTVDAFLIDAVLSEAKRRKRLFIIAILESCIPSNEIKERSCIYADPVRPKDLEEFIIKNTDINWNIRSLPSPAVLQEDQCFLSYEWIAEYYLNPLVNELMKGRTLARYTG
jgi:DNA mismatch endonuclease, patch repair protein